LLLSTKASSLHGSSHNYDAHHHDRHAKPMNCNICDQLAAEMGELLLKQKKATGIPGESVSAEEAERIETALRAARQKLIDHLRLIHGSA
jgi:hypothetical protein